MAENENKPDEARHRRIADIQAERTRLLAIGRNKMTPADLRTLRRITADLMALGGPDLPETPSL